MFCVFLTQLRNVCFVFFLVGKMVASESPLFKVCKTEECIKISASIKATMNTSIDPCQDFYRFVCGKYLDEVEIKSDKSSASTSDEVEDKIMEELRQTLTDKLPKNLQYRPFKMAQTFYKQCMDESGIDKLGLDKAKEWYKVFGGWPVLEGDAWDEERFDWINVTLQMYRYGFGYNNILDVNVFPHPQNTTKRVLELDQSDLGVDSEFMKEGFENNIVQAYYKFMVDTAVLYGADKERAMKELKESLAFEIQLGKITIPIEEMRDHTKLFNPMSLPQLQEVLPFVPWQHFFRHLVPSYVTFPRPDETINVYVPTYFQNLAKLLEKTPKRVLANYLLWKAALENTPFLTSSIRNLHLEFLQVVTGVEKHTERYKECVDRTAELMDLTVSAMYVRQHTKPNLKPQAMDMVKRIHKEMVQLLTRVKWMDERTRKKAIEKSHTMMFHVGFPDELLDNRKLEKYYENVTLASNFFDSVNKFMEEMNPDDFRKLDEPFNKSDWTTHANSQSVNAYYNSPENSIEIPAGILRRPFFAPDRPSYLNYGAIGYVIAHEMIHAFDDEGRQYDKDGNLFDWWDKKTKQLYMIKAQKIVEEYSNFTVQDINMKLKGKNTQGENIADHAGARVAYEAYVLRTAEYGEEPRLPDFQHFSPRQMFWVSGAHSWCTKYRPEALKLYLASGYHPPAEYRINGPYRYSKHFAKDFQCPLGSFMNPPVKYNIW